MDILVWISYQLLNLLAKLLPSAIIMAFRAKVRGEKEAYRLFCALAFLGAIFIPASALSYISRSTEGRLASAWYSDSENLTIITSILYSNLRWWIAQLAVFGVLSFSNKDFWKAPEKAPESPASGDVAQITPQAKDKERIRFTPSMLYWAVVAVILFALLRYCPYLFGLLASWAEPIAEPLSYILGVIFWVLLFVAALLPITASLASRAKRRNDKKSREIWSFFVILGIAFFPAVCLQSIISGATGEAGLGPYIAFLIIGHIWIAEAIIYLIVTSVIKAVKRRRQ